MIALWPVSAWSSRQRQGAIGASCVAGVLLLAGVAYAWRHAEPVSDAQIHAWRALASARDSAAEQSLQQQAERGNALAARLWGELLAQRDTASAVSQARHWLAQAAQQGDARAALSLGKLNFKGGAGLPPDPHSARPWLEMAAARGQEAAAHYLGLIERQGGHPQAARPWLERAARVGYADSQFLLAQMLLQGEGGEPDLSAARHWLEAAAEQDHPEATLQLLMARRQGQLGYEADPQAERHLWMEAQHALRHRPPSP